MIVTRMSSFWSFSFSWFRMAPRSGWFSALRFSGRFSVMRLTNLAGSSTMITSLLMCCPRCCVFGRHWHRPENDADSGGHVAAGERDRSDGSGQTGVDGRRQEGAGCRDLGGATEHERLEQQAGEDLHRRRPRVLD